MYRSPGYLPQCEGILPVKGVYSHISGIDLVKGKDGVWYILEDNLRIPSGASSPSSPGTCAAGAARTPSATTTFWTTGITDISSAAPWTV